MEGIPLADQENTHRSGDQTKHDGAEVGIVDERRRAFVKRLVKAAAIAPAAVILYDAAANSQLWAIGS